MRAEILAFVTLGGFALGAPTPTLNRAKSAARRAAQSGFPGLGELGDLPGLGELGDLPGLGGDGEDGGFLGGLPGLGGLGGSDSSSGGLGGLGGILGGLGGSNDLAGSDSTGSDSAGSDSAGSDSAGSDSSTSSGGLGDFGSMIPSLGGGSSTENGVTDNEACQPLTFIFARGTSETGNMGSVVGPPVADALRSSLNDKVTVQGVDYPASAAGNAAMGAEGGPEMEKLAKQAISQCPDTKIALGGYSQGAMVVHNAAKSVDQVAAAVVFGDPLKTMPIGSVPDGKVKGFCAQGDPVCANGANFMAHISYGGNAEEAAKFIVQAAGAQ